MHGFSFSPVHGCDLIRFNFPDTKIFKLRMREICPDLFKTYEVYPRLEQMIISLDLEPESWKDFDEDTCAVDCEDYEILGEELVGRLKPSALSFFSSLSTPNLTSLELRYPLIQEGEVRMNVIKSFSIEAK
jgi:hypothetical protein